MRGSSRTHVKGMRRDPVPLRVLGEDIRLAAGLKP
jgi:hypothetical protein